MKETPNKNAGKRASKLITKCDKLEEPVTNCDQSNEVVAKCDHLDEVIANSCLASEQSSYLCTRDVELFQMSDVKFRHCVQ